MTERILIGLVSIILLGVGAQWLAWRLHLPSILLLLIIGFFAGPVTGFLDPDALLGDLLLPVISLSVAVILFEGGLSLRFSELPKVGSVVRNLISVGVLATWLICAGAAHLILGLNLPIALLLGAILVVTGPTVIGPLLRHVRPTGSVGPILKWEGILNDPIGATLAVLVFQAIIASGPREATALAVTGLLETVLIGVMVGVLSAGFMTQLLKHYWIPDFLQNPVSLMLVVSAFAASNSIQPESGLLAVTVMGVALANQKTVAVKHIIEFKENLRVLLISILFILLAARLQISSLTHINLNTLTFLVVLMLVARPVSVMLSTLGSGLSWRERLFLSWLAPRGIVAGAVSSVFALRLVQAGYPQAELLVPLTFLVIVSTVAIYGIAAFPIARWLKLAQPKPQGVLIVGAHPLSRAIARTLLTEHYNVLLADTSWTNISAARLEGIPTYYDSIIADYTLDEIDLGGIGRLLALTSNDGGNALAALHFAEVFGRSEVYQLRPESGGEDKGVISPRHLHGRFLFGTGMTYTYLTDRFAAGAVIRKTALTKEFDYEAFQRHYGGTAIPLFLINQNARLTVFTEDNPPKPQPGQTLISLVNPEGIPAKTTPIPSSDDVNKE